MAGSVRSSLGLIVAVLCVRADALRRCGASVRRAAVRLAADDPAVEQWREFRARLITDSATADTSSSSPQNIERLRLDNEELWAEYRSGASWAHPLALPEPACVTMEEMTSLRKAPG